MIVVEEQHYEESERKSHEDPFHIQIPKVDKPITRLCGIKSSCDGDEGDVS